jgi:hypothetical protein
MTTILALGSEGDACMRAVRQEAVRRGVDLLFVSEAELSTAFGMNLVLSQADAEGYLIAHSRRLPFADLDGMLLRLGAPLGWCPGEPDAEKQYMQGELKAAFFGLFQALRCPVVNPLRPVAVSGTTAANPTLARAARECGFVLPPSLVTSNPAGAREFYEHHGRRALSGPPLFLESVVLCGTEGAATLTAQAARPCYLQAVPPGRRLRLIVAGEQAFAAELDSPVGSAGATGRAVPVSQSLSDGCRRLAAKLGLGLFELTVVAGGDGRDYCFALNEFPTYDGWEESVCNRVTGALVDVFTRPAHPLIQAGRIGNPSEGQSRRAAA